MQSGRYNKGNEGRRRRRWLILEWGGKGEKKRREGLEGEKRNTNRRRGGMGEDLGAGVEDMMDAIR